MPSTATEPVTKSGKVNVQFDITSEEDERLLAVKDECGFRSKREAMLWGLSIIEEIVDIKKLHPNSKFGFAFESEDGTDFSTLLMPWLRNIR